MSRDVERYLEAKAAAARRDMEALVRALAASMRAAADKLEAAIGEYVADLGRVGVAVEDLAAAVAEAEQSPEPRRQSPPPARPRRKRGPPRKDLGPKTCPVCGEVFERRAAETTTAFKKRATCGKQACRHAWISARLAGVDANATHVPRAPLRTCRACGQEFERRPGERLGDYNRRATCLRPECVKALYAEGGRRGGAAKRKAASPAPSTPQPTTPRPPVPPPPPREPRVPEPPIPTPPPAIEAEEPWQPPQRHEPVRVQPVGEPCPEHPGEVIGVFGCPACNAGKRWRERGQIARVGVGSRP